VSVNKKIEQVQTENEEDTIENKTESEQPLS